ncbi:zinc finger protein 234-like isoform X2 [Armigeres subalbatus]|uniref:zinc finger protein 234-like isoform X2 n=1 Tax=Armigeres subalbatus TaxID=124917 RepID=UPI002ED5BA14
MTITEYFTACRFCLRYDATCYDIVGDKCLEEKIRKVFKFTEFLNRLLDASAITAPLDVPEPAPSSNLWTIEHPTVHIQVKLTDEPHPASECGEPTEVIVPPDDNQSIKKRNLQTKGNDSFPQHMSLYCNICGDSSEHFDNFSKLLKHFKETHETRGYAVCCDRKFFRKDRLLDHFALHINPNAFKCNECGHRSKNALLLEIHRKQHSTTERRYVCDMCDKTFVTKSQLYNHMPKHGVKRHRCDVCGKLFGHKFTLTQHRLKHEELDKFICEICAKPLSTKSNLNAHIRTHHARSDDKVQCSFCAKWFKNAETLRSHCNARHKDQREHRCAQCGKLYPTGSGLMEHVRRVHRKQTNYSCDQCSKKFFKKSSMVEHIKRSHSGPNPKPMFKCEFCDKEYLHSNNYFFHRKKAHPDEYAQLRRAKDQQRIGLKVTEESDSSADG